MIFALYLADASAPLLMDAGSAEHAADVVAAGAERGYFRGLMIGRNGSLLARQVPVPIEAVRRVERAYFQTGGHAGGAPAG